MVFEDDNQDNTYKSMKGEVKKMCKCSLRTRLTLFCIFFVIGWVLCILGVIVYFVRKNIVYFAVLYSIGQLFNLAAYEQ
jgi:hypothetical protein